MAKKLNIGGYDRIRPDGFESRGGVPPYYTGHTPPPPRRGIVGGRLASKRVSTSQLVNFLDFDVTLERNACFLRFEGSDLVAKTPRGKIIVLVFFSILEHLVHPSR